MGLDLVPLGRPKPGHEDEWQRLMETLYSGGEESPENFDRRMQVSILPYEAVGAPRVGYDFEADKWFLTQKDKESSESDEEYLAQNKGHYALRLAQCDGVPAYSNGGLYEGVDETTFRGSFLEQCTSFLDKETLEVAWTDAMTPEVAAEYGRKLLKLASGEPLQPGQFRRLRKALGLGGEEESLEEQRNILTAAGRWYVFWGERGHPIAAYY